MTHQGGRSEYRPDIDALRGVAVLAVVIYHFWPTALKSGFIGVDIFFVISGFLITRIIRDDLAAERFSFAKFYARRVKRIFPALIIVLVTSVLATYGMLLNTEFRQLLKHVGGASVFISNFLLWSESGYFDAAAASKPLLHLWSLGIEEQFYLAWPLLVWLTWRRSHLLLVALLLLTVASFYLNVAGTWRDPVATFYSPVTRFWELMVGAALAVTAHSSSTNDETLAPAVYSRWKTLASQYAVHIKDVLSILGVLLLLLSFIGIKNGLGFPGWQAALPVIGAAFLIGSGPDTWSHRHVLTFQPLVWLGLISYPLYLWHWPLLSFAHQFAFDSEESKIGLFAVSVAMAATTYLFIERPIRFGLPFPRAKVSLLVLLMMFVGLIGVLGYRGFLDPNNDNDVSDFVKDSVWTYKDAPRFQKVVFNAGDFPYAESFQKNLDLYQDGGSLFFRKIPSLNASKTLYIGDSHMEHFWSRIDQVIQDQPTKARTGVFITASGFLPIPNVEVNPAYRPNFIGLAKTMESYAISDRLVDTVVISANWGAHFTDAASYRTADESLYYVTVNGEEQHLKAGRRANEIAIDGLSTMIRNLRHAGKRVFVVLTVPGGGQVTWHRKWGHFELAKPIRDGKEFLRENGNLRPLLVDAAKAAGADIIDPYISMCPNDKCPSTYQGTHPVYMDGAHVADRWVRTSATFLDQTLLWK